MAAPTTIQDLPDDMLHEIFGHLFARKPGTLLDHVSTTQPPEGTHLALRCVCRRWRDIADWARLSSSLIWVHTRDLADAGVDAGAIRARHPAAFQQVMVTSASFAHSASTPRAAASLINGSADLRRALSVLKLQTCCLASLARTVAPVASCTALAELHLFWSAHKKERVVPSNMLAPLSALRMLNLLVYSHNPVDVPGETLPKAALLTPLPALPDAPRLTCVALLMMGGFVPVGSDAVLGRLLRLDLEHRAPSQELLDAEDPFLLRAAFEAGTWQPSRLTGLQELGITIRPVHGARGPLRPSRTRCRSGSEWAPLAGQVTKLYLRDDSGGLKRPSTGIVAGLGVLTALRDATFNTDVEAVRSGWLEPVSTDRWRAPHLTRLDFNCVATPANLARSPNLVYLHLASVSNQPHLNLRSLVARSSLKYVIIGTYFSVPCSLNLAELFVGGGGWPVLESLTLDKAVLEWDATGLAGTPTATEFAQRARQLLPALVYVYIREPHGRGALVDPSRVGFVVACRRHVVPALKGLHTRKSWQ